MTAGYWSRRRASWHRLNLDNRHHRHVWERMQRRWELRHWRHCDESCCFTVIVVLVCRNRLIDACIQPTDDNCGPFVMVWGAIHHGGRSELLVLDGTLNCQCYIRLWNSKLACATGVFGQNSVYVQNNATPHRARDTTVLLLFFCQNRIWRSWTGRFGVQIWTTLSMYWNQTGVWVIDINHLLPMCQNCGMLSSRRGLQFAQEGWGPWWRACQIVCVLCSPPEGVTYSISGVVTWL